MKKQVADAVIVAAGTGMRMGAGHNKLLLKLDSRTILEKSLEPFKEHQGIRNIYVTTSSVDCPVFEKILADDIILVEGGKRRQDSLHQALLAIREKNDLPDLVLVHDGARPFCSSALIDRILEKTIQENAAIPVLPVVDTIRRITENKTETVDRSQLFVVQTPQGFREDVLFRASELALEHDWEVTDDASLLENNGQTVTTVPGEANNIKITTPEDMERAQWILKSISSAE